MRDHADRHETLRETLVLIILSVTAVLTAWSGFQASQWGGEMTISFSRAATERIEVARYENEADAARQADLTIWAVYLEAQARDDQVLSAYVEERFTPHFEVAYEAWVAGGRQTQGPFVMAEYVPPGTVEAADAAERADASFAEALDFDTRSDNYTLLTVLFAVVLFFAAVSDRLRGPRSRWVMFGMACILLVVTLLVLATFPVNV